MHPATPLIPAIWSSSKHAGDVKIPHLDVGEQQAPWIKMDGGEETEDGWRMEESGKQGGWGHHKVVVLVLSGGSSMCHSHILAALLSINFSHNRLRSRYIKDEGGGEGGHLYAFILATIWHHFTSYVEMSIAFVICLLPPSWPLLYVFDEGLPIFCPFLTLF